MRVHKFILASILLFIVSTASAQRPAPPEPQPLAKVSFPAYQTRKLPNGLTVYALEHHEQPTVALRLLITAGAVNDPNELPGVASMTADLLTEGTKTRKATEIAETIDQVGASLSAAADMESTIVNASALTDSVDLAFELMTDVVMNPTFEEEELARLKEQALSGLTAAMEDPDFIADAVFDRVVYGSHSYGHMADGTLESIPKVKRADIVKFHFTHRTSRRLQSLATLNLKKPSKWPSGGSATGNSGQCRESMSRRQSRQVAGSL